MKSPEESGEPENPTEKNPPRSNGKRPNDTLAIVSYWTKLAIGIAIGIFMMGQAYRIWDAIAHPKLHG